MSARNAVPYRRYPCAECPWRTDTEPGQFPDHRYEALRSTSGEPGDEAGLTAPMFACHKSPEGREDACAGWLAAAGRNHLGVRLAVTLGKLPREALDPGEDWPGLFGSYSEMASAQASRQDDAGPGDAVSRPDNA